MQITATTHDSGLVELMLAGRLDIAGTSRAETTFAVAANRDGGRVLVDLAGVDFLSSMGIRLLLVNAKALRVRGGQMVLLQPQPGVLQVLEMAGVTSLLPVHSDRTIAIDALLAHGT